MEHVCPWRGAYLFDHAGRRLFQKPERILAPYVRDGMTVLDIGPGMGFFAIPAARLVGPSGRVIAVDLQAEMLKVLMKRAAKKGVAERITPYRCPADDIGPHTNVDVAVAVWCVHEFPSQPALAEQVHRALTPGGKWLILEPKIHVTADAFAQTIAVVEHAGLKLDGRPRDLLSHAALFVK
jgi:ubiquinone/menaquinone biosynthesis C-methylase UbiE